MKRLLAIFVVLLLVLGGLFWHRKYENHLNYKNFSSYRIPLSNNIIIEDYFRTGKVFIKDISRYQWTINSPLKGIEIYWDDKRIIDFISGNVMRAFNPNVVKFNLYNNLILFRMESIDEPPDVYYHYFNLNEGIHYIRPGFKNKSQLLNHLNIKNEIKLKTYDEWLTIWKRDGRLPWFPEHVGK